MCSLKPAWITQFPQEDGDGFWANAIDSGEPLGFAYTREHLFDFAHQRFDNFVFSKLKQLRAEQPAKKQ